MITIHAKYILKESFISAIINALFSVVFVYAVFYPADLVNIFGVNGFIVDSIPQSFAIGLMATLVPTLLTRKKIKSGALEADITMKSWMPSNSVFRALLIAVIAALSGGALHFLLFSIVNLNTIAFESALIIKTIYGATLGAGVCWYCVRHALSYQPTEM